MQAYKLVQIVKAVKDAVHRIPEHLSHIIFFGLHDEWGYSSVDDNRRCKVCTELQKGSPFRGTNLRLQVAGWLAARLTVLSETRMGGPDGGDGMMHPNCRCRLNRLTPLRFKGKKKDEL